MNSHNDTKPYSDSLDILDLDKIDETADINYDEMIKNSENILPEEEDTDKFSGRSLADKIFRINWHLVLLIVFLISVIIVVYKIKNWRNVIDPNSLITEDDIAAIPEVQTYDNILPNSEAEGSPASLDGVTNIVLFGNGPFAENYGTTGSLSEIIAKMSNSTVYNCSVSGSHLAATNHTFEVTVDAMDAYNFYWLITLATLDNVFPCETALTEASEALPPEAREVFDILTDIDFSKVDVVGIMYDATDYLQGRTLYNAGNEKDIQTYYGNLTAGIELLQATYPHIRIIVMSPTYAYAVNNAGEYVDSDIYVYNEHPLSTYSQMLERSAGILGVSFVDNFYGTINVLNANDYLTDNVHLNNSGKQLLAERFVYALQYYD